MKGTLFVLSALLCLSILSPVSASELREQTCLNGWWDFLPVLTPEGKDHNPPGDIPKTGWLENKILVPGSWTIGEASIKPDEKKQPWEKWRLFDNYNNPPEWNDTNTAWYRRTFSIKSIDKDRRYFLYLGGVVREFWVFVNGRNVGHELLGIMPNEFDISDVVQPGENELIVYITDYRRDENGRTFVPTGADQMHRQKGIWNDVFLISRPDVYVEDITIRTSVRENELTLILDVKNASSQKRTIQPAFTIKDDNKTQLDFVAEKTTLPAKSNQTVKISQPWSSYIPWSPRVPQLYTLETALREKDTLIDLHEQRFGFRQVWIDGHHLMLNGTPVHLFGDWGHKYTLDNFRPEYVRQWYRMMKDCNMNYMRTHTYPHPKLLIDLADEMGILVSLESAWFFTHGQAIDKSETWENAEQHVRDIVKWYKNHPSIILWSVGNEVRWGWNRNAVIEHMPQLRMLYEKLDPTRIPYHDGDSSLWDERTQYLISRHYGYECTGEGWWDKSRPLHVGEVGKWHFAQPIDNTILGDDEMFASYEECARVVAEECADLAEQARANEVCCFFPWNLSCLDNYRPWFDERQLEWPDYSAPGIKPLRIARHGTEFAWWEPEGKGYAPGPGFEIMKHAFRPFALVVREKLNCVFTDQTIQHTITLVNDTGGTCTGTLNTRLYYDEKIVWEKSDELTIENGYTQKVVLDIQPAPINEMIKAKVKTVFKDKSQIYDSHVRHIRVMPESAKNEKWQLPAVAVFGSGSMTKVLESHNVDLSRVQDLKNINPAKTPVLLIEKDALTVGSRQNKHVESFLKQGGRAVILEQSASLLPHVIIENKPAEKCHIHGGKDDVLGDFSAKDFEFWGTDPFGRTNSDSWVVVRPYRKPSMGNTRILLHSGYGSFGSGGLFWSPLFETRVGDGLALACQLLITEKIDTHPVALRLLKRLLHYAAEWKPESQTGLHLVGTGGQEYFERLGVKMDHSPEADVHFVSLKSDQQTGLALIAEKVTSGGTAIVQGIDADAATRINDAFDIDLQTVDLGMVYNFVRQREDSLLDGLSNQETYWIGKGQYSSDTNVNKPFTDVLLRCEQGEELLISEAESCWRELHVGGARNERYRMPVVTHYLWDGPREYGTGLMRVKIGKGQLILCQIPLPQEDYRKADMIWSHLLNNLNVEMDRSLFQGEQVMAGSQKSRGFPKTVHAIMNPSERMVQTILKVAEPQEYRLPNQALENGFDWQDIQTSDGKIVLPQETDKVIIQFQVDPGRPRKKVFRDGLPDPSEQTLLDIEGKGKVTLYVNGERYASVELGKEGKTTISDIDLNQYWNSIILQWMPGGKSLQLQWRSRQHQPEVEFGFK